MKKVLFRSLLIISIILVLFGLFLLYATIFEYKPADSLVLQAPEQVAPLNDSLIYSAMIWNIGYAGLGSKMDFFYDGGKKVRDSYKNVLQNLNSILSFMNQNDTIDFMMLQEVDIRSKRSYRINEYYIFDSVLSGRNGNIGINYRVDFVPVPPLSPLGKVKSGIVTYSVFNPQSVTRYSFHGNYAWPTSIFMLKRCFMVNRYPLQNGREFVLINTHNSAYDDGSLRAGQLKELAGYVLAEYEKGNYVLIGGDWNQSPAGLKAQYTNVFDTVNVSYLPEDFLTGWQQLYSDEYPTNRRITAPYDPKVTPTTVIDFYIASPNIVSHTLQVIDLGFKNSDHQPVLLTFSFN